ncbi:hypothetical protein [Cesiribacter andamanensis]|uniref:Outer membrane protein beta-barrel domain-containing protein n=1 Tax=Cesiribacter andamanensis AMV16 TaxID=1279009 RepID=M7N121_9BACT|nr:hypothetical protein [Cesiribacter andamanensis]EMR01002.1 hypothetical protein ADICEAN_03868 [Cesiribacter andamanensis AMV16]
MKAPIFCILFASFLLLTLEASAQQREKEEDEYTREYVWGINKNTNGGYIGGFNLKFSRRVQPSMFRTLGFEIVNVKHPKEIRVPAFSGGSFILGKSNYLYSMRFSYGMERLLFRKGPQQGVQVTVHASGGPTLGIIAPYYIEVHGGSSSVSGFTTTAQYDPYNSAHVVNNIYGTGRPLEGIGQSDITAGLHARTGFSFEFGTFRTNVSGLELGIMLEAFPNEVVLLPRSENQRLFPSAYITLFHGSRR